MNIKKFAAYRAKADVVKIDISAFCAEVAVVASEGDKLYIEHSKKFFPHFAENDGTVTMRQLKGPFWNQKRTTIIVHVPECAVPSMNVNILKGNIKIDGGIYGDVQLGGKQLKAEVYNSTFENLTIKADELDVCADGITVKNLANATAADGRVEFDKTFCKKAECRIKKGNIGLCNSACDFALLNSDEGNIAASMVGAESDYTISLKGAAVSGKNNHSSSGKSIKARAERGSVVLDFSKNSLFDDELGEAQA